MFCINPTPLLCRIINPTFVMLYQIRMPQNDEYCFTPNSIRRPLKNSLWRSKFCYEGVSWRIDWAEPRTKIVCFYDLWILSRKDKFITRAVRHRVLKWARFVLFLNSFFWVDFSLILIGWCATNMSSMSSGEERKGDWSVFCLPRQEERRCKWSKTGYLCVVVVIVKAKGQKVDTCDVGKTARESEVNLRNRYITT